MLRGGGSARTLEWMRQVGERPGGRPPDRTAAAEARGRGLHRARATTVAAVAAIVLSCLVGPVDHATADLYAVTPGSRSPSAGTLALDAGDWDVQPDAYRGGWVVMQPWEFARIPALKKQNPDIRVLMYKDVSATVSTICVTGPRGRCNRDPAILPTGVGYWRASRRHPEWFLRTSAGDALEWSDWPGLHPMNIADPGYQRAWARSVKRELRAHDWDGVMMDDTLTRLSHSVVGDAISTQIPDDAAMYAATTSFLRAVATDISAAGHLAVPNVTVYEDNWRSTFDDWTRYVSGWENEYLVKYGLGSEPLFTGTEWSWRLRMLSWAAHRGVPILAVTYGPAGDRPTQLYHRATWLLAWNGEDGASFYVPEESGVSFWLRPAIKNIGLPTGPRVTVGHPGVEVRPYTHGVAVVNSSDHARSIPLGGTYLRHFEPVDRLELGPRSAAVLRSVGR